MSLAAGARLGPYEIVSALGGGGMGEVYKARDTRLDRTVAIKVLPAHVASAPDVRRRFEREARAVAALNHPHICTLHDVGSHEGVDFLVMEYVEGDTLATRLEKGALPLHQALQYGIEIASALDKAHRAGIVHRDLKPGNIMLTKAGAKLLDFGLAKTDAPIVASAGLSMARTMDANLTAQGMILGTFQYMAPEQLEGVEADARTDIFAFGAVLYEMLSGKKAFEGKNQASLIAAILEREPPVVSTIQPGTPAALDHVVRTCLAKNPDERWQTFTDLQRQLRWILDSGLQSRGDPPAIARRNGKRRVLAAGAIAVVTGLVASAAAWMLKPETPRRVVRFDITLPEGQQFSNVGRHLLALSSDGRHLVYSANGRLNLRSMDQLQATTIRGTEEGSNPGRNPFFSPDGRWIGFWQEGQLRRVSITGGAAVKLCDALNPFGVSWGADDTILYGQGPQGIWRVSGQGGAPQVLIPVDAAKGESAHGPQMLPDGDHVLFTLAIRSGWDDAKIVVHSLANGQRKVLVDGGRDGRYLPTGHLVYVREGTLFAAPVDLNRLELTGGPVPVVEGVGDGGTNTGAAHFSVSLDGTLAFTPPNVGAAALRTLVWVDRTGKEEPVPLPRRAYRQLRLSPDGGRLAVSADDQEVDIWVWDSARGSLGRVTSDPARDLYPLWTPDGSRIIFQSARQGSQQLWWQMADGTGTPERLFETKSEIPTPMDVSRDMQLVFYERPTGGTRDVMRLTLDDKRELSPLLQTPFEEQSAFVSPDGHWLAYQSDASGQFEVYVRSFPNTAGPQFQISTAGGRQPMWARSGRELFFEGPDGMLMHVDVNVKGTTWSASAPAKVLNLGPYVKGTNAPAYDISPDGRRFVMMKPVDTPGPEPASAKIIMVENWFEELKQRVLNH